MSQFTNFDGLPVIVHDRILRYLPSPQDLANTIRASPGSLHAFMTGRRRILLCVLRNFLSLENQNLMNLVMAAPHFFCHRQVAPVTRPDGCCPDDASPGCRLFTAPDFERAANAYTENDDMRHLTMDTIECAIRLYGVLRKVIRGYNSFTLARSQRRVPNLSTPEASRWRDQFPECHWWEHDHEETCRLWRGFLNYELVCIMHGVPEIMDEALGKKEFTPEVTHFFPGWHDPTTYVEEMMCVQHYVREQYDLAFNALVESFELAVGELGRHDSDTTPVPTHGAMPIVNMDSQTLRVPVQHLVEPPCHDSNSWTTNIAVLGVSFMQEFLSWDESTRLDFIRITYPFLGNEERCFIEPLLSFEFSVVDLVAKNYGWTSHYHSDHGFEDCQVDDDVQLRLRSVGWIFWENPSRNSFMSLVEDLDEVNERYGSSGGIRIHLRLQGRPHLLEKSVDPQEWKGIVKYFGTSLSERQLNDVKGLFKSIGDLKSTSVADTVSALRSQDDEDAPGETQENSD